MAAKNGMLFAGAMEDHRQVGGEEAGASHGDERSQGMSADEPVDDVDAGLFVVLRNVHGLPLSLPMDFAQSIDFI
jgi:hypothetical protein